MPTLRAQCRNQGSDQRVNGPLTEIGNVRRLSASIVICLTRNDDAIIRIRRYSLRGGNSMLGHLVFGRYGSENASDAHATRNQTGWVERLLNALLRRRAR
jgi:hypothetical protein